MQALGDIGLGKLLRAFAVLALALLTSLLVAAGTSYFTEWRAVQKRYNDGAEVNGLARLPVAPQQIWKPELGVTDRCTSCHVAMGGAAPLQGERLFAAHPPGPHVVRDVGCTICHGGQGRATNQLAAHGRVRFWDLPLLSKTETEAGCGTCHSHVRVPNATRVAEGRRIVDEQQCRGCHDAKLPLDGIGIRGFAPEWHAQHAGKTLGEMAFAPLLDEEVLAVNELLQAQVGAPRLMAAKMLAHQLGCRGCHRIGQVGGEEGPDLDGIGRRAVSDLDFTGVTGEPSLSGWLKQHFLEPARVVKDSRMPNLNLTDEQAGLLTLYMLSLRSQPLPDAWTPKDRVRVTKLGEREFATDGESLFLAFCVACHGEKGHGRTLPKPSAVPTAIGRAEFLAVADDSFIKKALINGRPGRQMPSWGTMEGGLRPAEIEALVDYLRALQPEIPSFETVMTFPPDVEAGRAAFLRSCAACHGESGEGSIVAPPLAARDNLTTGSENAIYGTLARGVAGTAMGSFRTLNAATLRSLIAAVRALAPVETSRSDWKAMPGRASEGAPLYAQHCATCHGESGEGGDGPALANDAFLTQATDGYITATIVRGRVGVTKTMPAFGTQEDGHVRLSASQVADLVAFLRSFRPIVPVRG